MENLVRSVPISSECRPGSPSEMSLWNGPVWMIKLTKTDILFNHEEFPDWEADDFAKEFINILEKNFKIKFETKDELK